MENEIIKEINNEILPINNEIIKKINNEIIKKINNEILPINNEIIEEINEENEEDEENDNFKINDDRFLKEAIELHNFNQNNEKNNQNNNEKNNQNNEENNKFHGKVVQFNNLKTFIKNNNLNRDYFLDEIITKKVKYDIENNKPVLFLPNDIYEDTIRYMESNENEYDESGKLLPKKYINKYVIYLFGILANGSKATVLLNNIEVYFDILIPKEWFKDTNHLEFDDPKRLENEKIQSNKFAVYIKNLFSDINLNKPSVLVKDYDTNNKSGVKEVFIEKPYKIGIKNLRHFKSFQEGTSKFLRIYHYKLIDRKNAIEYFRNIKKYETSNDDLSSYYRKVCRDYSDNIKFSNFSIINKYELINSEDFKFKTKYNFSIDIKNYKFLDFENNPKLQDEILNNFYSEISSNNNINNNIRKNFIDMNYTMTCAWDIETYDNSKITSGDIPRAAFGKVDEVKTWRYNDNTVMFMNCMVFNWWFTEESLLNVCIVDRTCAKMNNKLTIVCNNEQEIIMATGIIFELMQPDIFFGFNSGDYDIPYLIQSAYAIRTSNKNSPAEIDKNSPAESNKNSPAEIDKNSPAEINEQSRFGVFTYNNNYIKSCLKYNNILKKETLNSLNNNIEFNSFNLIEKLSLMKPSIYRINNTTNESKIDNLKFNFKKLSIKLEAQLNADEWIIEVPGFICMDVRTIFRKLYNKANKSSLNFYLKENKMELKKDMPYTKLFYIYKLCSLNDYLIKIYGSNFSFNKLDYDIKFKLAKILHSLNEFSYNDLTSEQINYINNQISKVKIIMNYDDVEWEKIKPRDKFYKASGLVDLSLFENISEFQKDLINLTVKEMDYCNELMSLVGEYCYIDSLSCHKLTLKRNVIQDKREMSNMSYSSLFDAIFRADGFRIRNILICEGLKEGISISNISKTKNINEDSAKYPGAFVCPPCKGLYKPLPTLYEFYNMLTQ